MANECGSLLSVLEERVKQQAKWTIEHDDENTTGDWRCTLEKYLDRLIHTGSSRENFVKIAAVALAAIEALDRREK